MCPSIDTTLASDRRDGNRADALVSGPALARLDEHAWDAELSSHGGHLMQSWRWGEFKRREGWRVERIRVTGRSGTGMAQALFWPVGPTSTAFIPRGPVVPEGQGAVAAELLTAIDAACRRHRALSLGIETAAATPFDNTPERFGFVYSVNRYSPARTVIVPLSDDETLLDQMHPGTRYKIRRAQRSGVEIRHVPPDDEGVAIFHRLLQDTAQRQGFRVNPPAHYADVLRLFGDDAVLLVASVAGDDVAGLIAARFDDEAIYLFGGSASVQSVRGATHLLQFAAMQWARSRGCTRYDLWGIDSPLNVEAEEGSIDRSTEPECAPDNGLCQFKVGFGGEIRVYPKRIERVYHPYLTKVLRRLKDARASRSA